MKFLHQALAFTVSYKKEEDDGEHRIVAKVKGKDVGSIRYGLQYLGDENDEGVPWFLEPYAGEKFLDEILAKGYDALAEVKDLRVDKEYRQHGIATALMTKALAELKKKYSNDPIFINASPNGADRTMGLETLVKFYEKFGFKVLKSYPAHRNAFMWKG